jgi:predicted amidohydrolase
MADIKVASVQFESAPGDKRTNLQRISTLAAEAASKGVKIIAFHECSISSYTFAQRLSREKLYDVAEVVPGGPSCQELIQIARGNDVAVLAGLFERDEGGKLYNTYVCATGNGIVAKFRKIHPFINPELSPGKEYIVFDLFGWKCGVLICYDNNVSTLPMSAQPVLTQFRS